MSNETYAFEIKDLKKYNKYSKGRLISFVMAAAGLIGSAAFTLLRDRQYEYIDLYDDEYIYDEEEVQNGGEEK